MSIYSAPSAIVFVNDNISSLTESAMVRQMFINESIPLAEFNARIVADPNYPSVIHLNGLRVLVKANLQDATNRNFADIVLFVKGGLVAIEQNKFGPHGFTVTVQNIYLSKLFDHLSD